MKRTITIIVTIIIIMALGAAYYYFVWNKPILEQTENEAPQTDGLSVLIQEKTIAPILSFSGETVWFFTEAGRLYRKPVTPHPNPPHQGEGKEKREFLPTSGGGEGGGDDKEEYLLPQLVREIREVNWQSGGIDFIIKQNLNGHIRYQFFDSGKKAFTPYPDALREPRFLASANKIIYYWVNSQGVHELTMADFDSSNFQKVSDLYLADWRFETSPTQNQVVLFTDDFASPVKLSIYDLETNIFEDVGEAAAYEGVKFSPDGSKLLLAKIESLEEDPQLYVYDLYTKETRPLGLTGEISQAAWQSNSRDVIVATIGAVSRVSAETLEKELIYKFDSQNLAPTDLLIHPSKPIIFFVDGNSGYLYKLELK